MNRSWRSLIWGVIVCAGFAGSMLEPSRAQDPVPIPVPTPVNPKPVPTPIEPEPVTPDAPVASITFLDEGETIPETVPLGEPIYLSGKKAIRYREEASSIIWKVSPPDRTLTAKIADNGDLFIIGTGDVPGVTITVCQTVTLNNKLAQHEIRFKVAGKPVDPNTPVTPDTPDKPVTPDKPDADQLKSRLKGITADVPAAAAGQKAAVAVVFRNVAKQVQANQIQSMDALTRQTADQMRTVVGLNSMPVWIVWRKGITQALELDGRFKTLADQAAAWNLIADVLEGK